MENGRYTRIRANAKKISYLEQKRGQRKPTMARNFSLGRVKYYPFHSQYVICSFPYDRSMIRFKNVHRFARDRDALSPVPFFSRLFRARANPSAGVAAENQTLSKSMISKNYESP